MSTSSGLSLDVLLVEDSKTDALLLQHLLDSQLENQFRLTHLTSLGESIEHCRSHTPDIVLLDLGLPDSFGIDSLNRFTSAHPDLPVVVLTGASADDMATQVLRGTAQDFLEKGNFQARELARTLLFAHERSRTQQLLSEHSRQLEEGQRLRALTTLTGGIAHRFNNLLGVIQGYGEHILREVPEDSQLARDMGCILRAADQAAGLTRELLTFGGHQDRPLETLSVHQRIRDLDTVLPVHYSGSCNVSLDLCSEDLLVEIIPDQFDQLLINLCLNSCQAMPEGGAIRIRTEAVVLEKSDPRGELQPGPYVRILVEDTGPGISPEHLPRIFDPFFTTRSWTESSGLGLSSALGIVRQRKGTLRAQSEPGAGTTMEILLPRAEPATATPGTETSPPAEAPPPGPGSGTILVVDDEPDLLELTARALESQGYQALVATSGEQALELLEKSSAGLSLVLLDLIMPDMGGTELARRIEQHYPELPILFYTGYSGKIREEQTRGHRVLRKPCPLPRLLSTLAEILDGGNR